MRDLCRLVGAGNRTLRLCCAEFLGISQGRHALLRIALRDTDPLSTGVAELAGRYGFTQFPSFAGLRPRRRPCSALRKYISAACKKFFMHSRLRPTPASLKPGAGTPPRHGVRAYILTRRSRNQTG